MAWIGGEVDELQRRQAGVHVHDPVGDLRQPLLALGEVDRARGDAVARGALPGGVVEGAVGPHEAAVRAHERDVRVARIEDERMLVGVHLLVVGRLRVGRHVGEGHACVLGAHDRAPVGAVGRHADERLVLQGPDLLVDHRAAEPHDVGVLRVGHDEQVVVALAWQRLKLAKPGSPLVGLESLVKPGSSRCPTERVDAGSSASSVRKNSPKV